MAVGLAGYLLLFGLLTVQDQLSGPQAVPYTEFKTQVGGQNVAEVFARGDSIEGSLTKPCRFPARRAAPTSSSPPSDPRSRTTTCWRS